MGMGAWKSSAACGDRRRPTSGWGSAPSLFLHECLSYSCIDTLRGGWLMDWLFSQSPITNHEGLATTNSFFPCANQDEFRARSQNSRFHFVSWFYVFFAEELGDLKKSRGVSWLEKKSQIIWFEIVFFSSKNPRRSSDIEVIFQWYKVPREYFLIELIFRPRFVPLSRNTVHQNFQKGVSCKSRSIQSRVKFFNQIFICYALYRHGNVSFLINRVYRMCRRYLTWIILSDMGWKMNDGTRERVSRVIEPEDMVKKREMISFVNGYVMEAS